MRVLPSFLLATLVVVDGFQFMKNWKLPTRNKNAEIIQDRFGTKKLVVLTGAESEVGIKTTKDLLATGEYHVIGGVRSLDGISESVSSEHFTPFECDLESLGSVRSFCDQVQEFCLGKPVDRLVCHAGDASSSDLKWTKDNHETNMQVNFLSPFLMTGRLLADMEGSFDARLTYVCPPEAKNAKISNLVNLEGFQAGFKNVPMADGSTEYDEKKAVEDAKLCQKLLTNFLHEKYHKLNHVSFNDISLSDDTSSDGLFQVIHDPKSGNSKSGTSWKSQGDEIVECDDEDEAKCFDIDKAYTLFELAQKVTEAEWPKIKVVTIVHVLHSKLLEP